MKNKTTMHRLMFIKYQQKYIDKLKTVLEKDGIPHVTIKQYEFADGDSLWYIYIDKGSFTWAEIKEKVNAIHAVPFSFLSNEFIRDGKLYAIV